MSLVEDDIRERRFIGRKKRIRVFLIVDERQAEPCRIWKRRFVYLRTTADSDPLLIERLRFFDCLFHRWHCNDAVVTPGSVACHDDIGSIWQRLTDIRDDALERLAAQYDRMPRREGAKTLEIVGNLPEELIPLSQLAIPPNRGYGGNDGFFHGKTVPHPISPTAAIGFSGSTHGIMIVPMQSYEVEVKALLGSKERADEIRAALKQLDAECELVSQNKQLNHYFEGGTIAKLADVMRDHLSAEYRAKLDDLSARAKSFSVRTRDKDNIVILVVKASVGDDSSENGVARMEFEAQVPLSLNELDELVLSAGFTYQAKWSREREEYLCNGTNVTIDKNAGYGYVAEFERVVSSEAEVGPARADIDTLMKSLGIEELPQDRLERMFAFYNRNWPEYYGTDKIFTIE